MEIISSHEHFIALNLPNNTKTTGDMSLSGGFIERHYLIGLFLHEFEGLLANDRADIRIRAIGVLRSMLLRHDRDPRCKDRKISEKVYNLYLPVMTIVSKFFSCIFQY